MRFIWMKTLKRNCTNRNHIILKQEVGGTQTCKKVFSMYDGYRGTFNKIEKLLPKFVIFLNICKDKEYSIVLKSCI